MTKFFAVVRREYIQRVRTKMFIFSTLLGPLILSLFGIVPALIFSIRTGDPIRIAVVDETGKIYERFYSVLLNVSLNENGAVITGKAVGPRQAGKAFVLNEVLVDDLSIEEVKSELNLRVRENDLDAYLVLPAHLLEGGRAEFFGRHTGDVFTIEQLQEALSRAVREVRLTEAQIDVRIVRELSSPVRLQVFRIGAAGEEQDRGEGFMIIFVAGFVIYLTILMYGQVILGAVIEEKETRIAEILLSSVKPFSLMMGKLIGVSLVALTQLGIWSIALIAFAIFGVGMLVSQGVVAGFPSLSPVLFLYVGLFFLLGYFIYATIYVLIGSMVTTAQEGGQLAMPVILLLAIAFYLVFPVIRSPDSSFAFWVSIFPFFAPITMLVRIVTQTPPFWQIALSLLVGLGTVVLITWVSSRVYRVGMLMYGKRASIPEVIRWVRQT